MALVVDNPGLLTTVQDEGRFGYARFGMSPSGPMDRVAFETANILVGNDPGESALEMTMLGPTLTLLGEGVLAVTGADMASRINGRPCPRYQAVAYHDGDRLEMGFAASGARAYLAVSGGFDVPKVMGSRSTAVQNQVGGFEGRKLKAGDRLALGTPKYLPADPDPRHAEPPAPLSFPLRIRVIPGPQEDAFTSTGLDTFYGTEYTLGADSNRMGYRLEGPVIEMAGDGNIISDGIVPGCIQVPGAGLPIILLQECQTVGGYPKIATVIAADMPLLGQCKPGDRLVFQPVTMEEAHRAYFIQQKAIFDLDRKFNYTPVQNALHWLGQLLSGHKKPF